MATVSGRLELQQVCLSYAGERPILGYGYGGFWTPRHMYEVSALVGARISGCTSAYIELLLGLGVIGTAIYSIMLLLGLRQYVLLFHRSGNPDYAFWGAVIVYVVLIGLAYASPIQATFLSFVMWLALLRATLVTSSRDQATRADQQPKHPSSGQLWPPTGIRYR